VQVTDRPGSQTPESHDNVELLGNAVRDPIVPKRLARSITTTKVPASAIEFLDSCGRFQDSETSSNRFVYRGRVPSKWKQISAIASADCCERAVWWRGCNPCVVPHSRDDRLVCSIVLVELCPGTNFSTQRFLSPRFVMRVSPVPDSVSTPSADDAFWVYKRRVLSSGSVPIASAPIEQQPGTIEQQPNSDCIKTNNPDKILAQGRFLSAGAVSKEFFLFGLVPDDFGVVRYFRSLKLSMVVWRGCCEFCRSGEYAHTTTSTCYLVLVKLRDAVLPDMFVAEAMCEWARGGYVMFTAPLSDSSTNWKGFKEGLFGYKSSASSVFQQCKAKRPKEVVAE
jgi:hypothetical protein